MPDYSIHSPADAAADEQSGLSPTDLIWLLALWHQETEKNAKIVMWDSAT